MFVILFRYFLAASSESRAASVRNYLIPGSGPETSDLWSAGLGTRSDSPRPAKVSIERFSALPMARLAYWPGRTVWTCFATVLVLLVDHGVGFLCLSPHGRFMTYIQASLLF